jgi:hypothetical protein
VAAELELVDPGPDARRVGGIHADDEALQRGVDQMADAARGTGMMALAPADKAVLGRHLHHDAVALGHGADAERDLQFLGHPVARGIGFDVDDLHFRAPIIPIVADAPPANPGVHPERETHNAVGFSKRFCREFPQFPQAIRQSGLWSGPIG